VDFLMQNENMNIDQKTNKRTTARLGAVQALYQMDIADTSLEEILVEFSAFRLGKEVDDEQYLSADHDFFTQIVKGVIKSQLSIDPLINDSLSDDWPVSRIDATLRAILRAGAFELSVRKDIPAKVVLSEYIDLAKSFFEGDEVGLVNAVLDKIAKTISKAEVLPSK